jgi:hypothetical protein
MSRVRRPESTGIPARWRQRGRWRYGRLTDEAGRERDGSVLVWDDYTGGARCLRPDAVQRQTRGPRGGSRWDWITPPRPVPLLPAPPAWKAVEGPCELFTQLPVFGEAP